MNHSRTTLLLLLVLFFICSEGGIMPHSCVEQDQCFPGGRQCGLYYACPVPKKPTKKPNVAYCDSCDYYFTKTAAPRKTCNFTNGRCQLNAIKEGAPCRGPRDVATCSKPLKCLPATPGDQKNYRCCRTTCPPGLCGAMNTKVTYEGDPCKQKLVCPGHC